MAQSADQIRQSDITLWGMVALACGAIAILSANIGGILPGSVSTALHATRSAGGNLNVLSTLVAVLRNAAARLRRENQLLTTRLNLAEESRGATNQRIGAVEASIPLLLDALPANASIDRDAITASIGQSVLEAHSVDGGSVAISRQPMPGEVTLEVLDAQDIPAVQTAEASIDDEIADLVGTDYAVALGDLLGGVDATRSWDNLQGLIGPLLLGLEPRLGLRDAGSDRLVAGPIRSYAQAEQLCLHVSRAGIACTPVRFEGDALAE
jgi:hypothetical protein